MISIIIPAHNEESVIGGTLATLLRGSGDLPIEVVVVCNGCSDRTAQVVRSMKNDVSVIEIAEASKIAALNAGDEAATYPMRIYLDADVQLDRASVTRLVQPLLHGSFDLAVPRSRYESTHSSWLVRSYIRYWQSLPQVRTISAGSGAFALSASGRARFATWPNITNDDAWIRATLFDRMIVVEDVISKVRAPRTIRAMIQRKARVNRGNTELEFIPRRTTYSGWWKALIDREASPLDLFAYFIVTLGSRLRRQRSSSSVWSQDRSSRSSVCV